MLRLSTKSLRISRITSALRTVGSVANDVENVTTGADLVQNFFDHHQVTMKGARPDQYQPFMSFDDTPFAPKLRNLLHKEGFDTPSPIQAISWPVALDKKDIISVAKTGSGKTLGFLLPGFHNILSKASAKGKTHGGDNRGTSRGRYYKSPEVLVLAPTRELGNQIAAEAAKYHVAGIDTVCVYGGASKGAQMASLRRGADCVVATPGRCIDLIDEGAFDLSQIRYLVLDEADRMLDMGFEPQIRQIIQQLPTAAQGRQSLFFTATWPKEVQHLASQLLTDPVQIYIGDQETLNANKDIKQNVMIVKEYLKQDALLDLLEQKVNPSDNPRGLPKTLVFASTKVTCDELQQELRKAGYSAAALHGDKSQASRDDVMSAFRRGKVNILIATDIAARGLDVKDVETVINFSFPNNTEDYVHRIGRTGRAGASGTSYTFLNQKDMENRRNMSDLVGVLTRCEQEVPAVLEEFRRGRSKHSTERVTYGRGSGGQRGGGSSRGGGGGQFQGRAEQPRRFGGRGGGDDSRVGFDGFKDRDAGRGDSRGRSSSFGGSGGDSRGRVRDSGSRNFNGYGNGQGNYVNRERKTFGVPEGEFGEEARGGGRFERRTVRYENSSYAADDFDDLDAARSTLRALRK